jgi:hypothetical protein
MQNLIKAGGTNGPAGFLFLDDGLAWFKGACRRTD